MTQYEFCCVEAATHIRMLEAANDLGAQGWQMVTTDRPHEFWIAVFQREKQSEDVSPVAINATGVGVFAIAGGDVDGRL